MSATLAEYVAPAVPSLSPDNSVWFLNRANFYSSDPYKILQEANATKSIRSLQLLSTNLSAETLNEKLSRCRLAEDHPYPFLPSPAELQEELTPLLGKITNQFPHITTNLNVSQPTASPSLVSINVLVRLYDADRRQRIKIKLGSFEDAAGGLFWEVGFVYLNKSIQQPLRKLLEQGDIGDYFLLRDLVDCTKRFISRRESVVGLDITPAYYHVAPLCMRMGGVPADRETLNAHIEEIREASRRYFNRCERSELLESPHQRRLVTSWLLENGHLRTIDGEPISWHPPRFIWKSPSYQSLGA